MATHYKYLGNIRNIPPHSEWNEFLSHWQAGDVVHWDWPTGAHSTFNAGYWHRALLRLSGLVTDRFKELADSSVPFELDYDQL